MFLNRPEPGDLGSRLKFFFSGSRNRRRNGSVKVCSPTIQPRCTKSVR